MIVTMTFVRVSECDQFYEWGDDEPASSGDLESASQYNISHFTSLCKIDGKRWSETATWRKHQLRSSLDLHRRILILIANSEQIDSTIATCWSLKLNVEQARKAR